MDRFDQLLAFLKEIEQMKHIKREIWTPDESRQENDAEHSWHLALYLLVFEKDLPEGFDLLRALKMALTHDLVEIYAGDTFAFDDEGHKTKDAREQASAQKLFSQLPPELEEEFTNLWLEFEQAQTREAKFVKSFDTLQATHMNTISNCHALRLHNISLEQFDAYCGERMNHHPLVNDLYLRLFSTVKEKCAPK